MIVRVKKRADPFVVLERETLRLKKISLKARGLWALCMSFPDDWEFRPEHLSTFSQHDGVTSIRTAMKELAEVGLAYLERARRDDGTLGGTRWVIYETSLLNPHRDAENLNLGENELTQEETGVDRDSGFPRLGRTETRANRVSGNRTLRSNEKARSTEKRRKNEKARNNDLKKQQQQRAPARATSPDGDSVAIGELLPAAAASFEDRSFLLGALVERGVDEEVAEALVSGSEPEHVQAMVGRFDREGGHKPGWLVSAIREGYGASERSKERMTHAEALTWLERNDIVISAENPMDRHLSIEREGGKTYFVPKAASGGVDL